MFLLKNTAEGIACWIKIQYQDTGHGILETKFDRKIGPFITSEDSKNGTALGLYFSYGNIQNHGGTIHVTSQINKGTMLTIACPVIDLLYYNIIAMPTFDKTITINWRLSCRI